MTEILKKSLRFIWAGYVYLSLFGLWLIVLWSVSLLAASEFGRSLILKSSLFGYLQVIPLNFSMIVPSEYPGLAFPFVQGEEHMKLLYEVLTDRPGILEAMLFAPLLSLIFFIKRSRKLFFDLFSIEAICSVAILIISGNCLYLLFEIAIGFFHARSLSSSPPNIFWIAFCCLFVFRWVKIAHPNAPLSFRLAETLLLLVGLVSLRLSYPLISAVVSLSTVPNLVLAQAVASVVAEPGLLVSFTESIGKPLSIMFQRTGVVSSWTVSFGFFSWVVLWLYYAILGHMLLFVLKRKNGDFAVLSILNRFEGKAED